MRILRFQCSCDDYTDRCYQLGRNHYVVLPEPEDVERDIFPLFTINVSQINQKNRHFWVGGHNAMILDLLSGVPQIEDHLSQNDFSTKLWNKRAYPNYQRRLDVPRAEGFSNWWTRKDSALVNAVTLSVDEDYTIEEGDTGDSIIWLNKDPNSITIRGKWLGNECGNCHSIENQLQLILAGPEDADSPVKKSAQSVLDGIQQWIQDTDLDISHARTMYCLNRRCHSVDAANHHTKSIATDENFGKKPFAILDGQHRIKGTQQGDSVNETKDSTCDTCPPKEDGSLKDYEDTCTDDGHIQTRIGPAAEEDIPFTLVTKAGGFDDDFQGKVFAEITTEAEGISLEHQLYMRWRYDQVGDSGLVGEDVNFSKGDDGEQHHRIYRVILYLAKTGILRGRFRPLGKIKNGKGDEATLKENYISDMNKMWEFINHIDNQYFKHIVIENQEYPGTWIPYYSPSTNLEKMEEYGRAVHNYLQACKEQFMDNPPAGTVFWSDDQTAEGVVSGPVEFDGAYAKEGGGGGARGNSFWWQAIRHLMPDVMREAAIDKVFTEDETITETELETKINSTRPPWFIKLPHDFTKEEIKAVLAPIKDWSFGKEDGASQNFFSGKEGKHFADEVLKPIIVKPRSMVEELHYILRETKDLGGESDA